MFKKVFDLIVVALLLSATSAIAAESSQADNASYIPRGDRSEGRKAFIQLSCIACHTVQGDPSLKAPWSATRGPMLRNTQNKKGRGYLLDSILLPSHGISGEKFPEGQMSPMGNYYPHAISVQQLLDISAYLDEAVVE